MSNKKIPDTQKSEIYYKKLIAKYGLWHRPEMTATIITEAVMYNFVNRAELGVKSCWKDIAKDIGISRSAMSRIATGKCFPSRPTMDKLVKYLDLTS